MKKILMAVACVAFLAGCGVGDVAVQIPRPMEEGNNGRIQQYLEETIMTSGKDICNFELLNQPNGNVVEVWANCQEFTLGKMGTEAVVGVGESFAAKITFANPTLHVLGKEGLDAFSDEAVTKINLGEFNELLLIEKNQARADKWLLGKE